MHKLHFDYNMDISYSLPVNTCFYTIKCIPTDSERQKLIDYTITIEPEHSESYGVDSFGNKQVYGIVPQEHDFFRCRVEGTVEMDQVLGTSDSVPTEIFKYPHGLNKSGEAIRTYYASIRSELDKAADDYEKSQILMHCLHRDYAYVQGTTGVKTSAEEAWKLGGGVCQDYTHIFTALSHLAGIPCRYVTGMIEGEGASHAWAEVYVNGKWYGFDPTNDVIAADRHIKIGQGRDAGDCQINRGIVKGGGSQSQLISVSVFEVFE